MCADFTVILNHEMEPVLSGRPIGIVKPERNLQVNVGDGFSGSQGPQGIVHNSNMYTAYNTSGGLPTVEDKAHSMLPTAHTDSPRVVRRKEMTRVASSSRLMASKIQKKARLQPPSETFSQRLGSQNRETRYWSVEPSPAWCRRISELELRVVELEKLVTVMAKSNIELLERAVWASNKKHGHSNDVSKISISHRREGSPDCFSS
ncbi:uncharacterized protein BDZ83DRAFT_81447 [Colletotrichum acutatum]|uniref:Uncharacterized protein n=1 Tax=Glomerella acutata TaxID=27357 RepID=A0AAD8XCM1_GLOAC|nr:uncharacterized protein BDZ83DRAFT_81447 [Colletotrichum acutatum]KAK1713397.1 hypothetical protein BDZ83DRAFT_81447 [Colletotrichum acutatum]